MQSFNAANKEIEARNLEKLRETLDTQNTLRSKLAQKHNQEQEETQKRHK
jgi:hypothetical protein